MGKSKKLGKISPDTKTTIPNPFESSVHKTERSGAAVVMHWMRDIIEEQNIDLGLPDVETGGSDDNFPDTIINKTSRSKGFLCVMEFKPPQWDPFNYDPKEPARKKATVRHAPYFVTSNFRDLILWNTERVNANKPEEEQIVSRYHLSDIYDLDMLEDNRYKVPAKNELEKFLTELYEFSTGTKVEPLLAVDELLIYRLQEKIGKLAYYYKEIIYDEAHKDKEFSEKLSKLPFLRSSFDSRISFFSSSSLTNSARESASFSIILIFSIDIFETLDWLILEPCIDKSPPTLITLLLILISSLPITNLKGSSMISLPLG